MKWLVLLALTSAADAHPVDEIVQSAYLTLAPGEVQLELDITPGAAVSAVVIDELDANRDQRITVEEARAYARTVLAHSTLDDKAWTLRDVRVPAYDSVRYEADTIKIYAVAPLPASNTLRYANSYAPGPSQCIANVFAASGFTIAHQQHANRNRTLLVAFARS